MDQWPDGKIVVVGAGGFGREVVSLVLERQRIGAGSGIAGVLDDGPSASNLDRLDRLGVAFLGGVDELLRRQEATEVALAVGSAQARRAIDARLAGAAVVYPVLVHPTAWIGPDVELGEGTIVAAGARLSTHIWIGRHGQIDQNATVGHDCSFADFVRLNPQACVSGDVRLGQGVTIGASATVLQGVAVGDGATVGAGAVVLRALEAGVTASGVPARVHASARDANRR